MTGKIKFIFIVLTPFHLKAFYAKYGDKINNANVIILKGKKLDDSLFPSHEYNLITIPNLNFSIFKFRKNPISTFLKYRYQIKKLSYFSEDLLRTNEIDKDVIINIGTDRDVFSQIFLDKIFKIQNFKPFLIAFDEGLGFYVGKTFLDHIKKWVYPLLSPILFGVKLRFYKPMGQHQQIKKVYCRYPEFISKKKNINYEKLDIRENKIKGYYNISSGKTLIFSFPNQDLGIDEKIKIKWISLVNTLLSTEETHVKLHPDEKKFEIKSLLFANKCTILNNLSIEQINYFDYKYIVNFDSSVVLDILASGYPGDKIITIGLGNKINISSIYNKTIKLKIKDLKNANQIRL
jgi:hypothetical protein